MATTPVYYGQQALALCASDPGRAAVACTRAAGAHVEGASAMSSANKTSPGVNVHKHPAFELKLLLIRPK